MTRGVDGNRFGRQEFEEGLPPGYAVIISEKSAYITSKIYTAWMEGYFLPRKPSGMDIHHMSVALRLWISEMKTT
jgi:hypothetical protein